MGIYPFPDGDIRDFDKVFKTLIEVLTHVVEKWIYTLSAF